MLAKPVPDKLGDYEIIRPLESGGMGEVLLARRRGAHDFERLVAIKTIRKELQNHDEIREMFLDEVRLMSRITHPAIAQVFDFGDEDGCLYLVMEYVDGVSFREVIDKRPPLRVALDLCARVCRGLHAAHELRDSDGELYGVVHRDISPPNLMMTFDGAVKILDFGIALATTRRGPVTQVGVLKGKPAYMSPEQLRGIRVDRRADIWAIGGVLFELLTGERVIRGSDAFRAVEQLLSGDLRHPSELVPELPPAIDDLTMKSLALERTDRFDSAAEMADALERAAADCDGPDSLTYVGIAFSEERANAGARFDHDRATGAVSVLGRPTGMQTAQESPLVRDRPTKPGAQSRRRWFLAIVFAGLAASAVVAVALDPLGWFAERQTTVALASADAAPNPALDASVAVAVDQADAAASPDARAATKRPHQSAKTIAKRPPPRRPTPDAAVGETPAVVTRGTIQVLTAINANVYIDNQLRGTGDTTVAVPVGLHTVVVTHPIDGRVLKRTEVVVEANKRRRVKVLER